MNHCTKIKASMYECMNELSSHTTQITQILLVGIMTSTSYEMRSNYTSCSVIGTTKANMLLFLEPK